MKKISQKQFRDENKNGKQSQCLDVREPAEFGELRADGFELYPLSSLNASSMSKLEKNKTTYLLCRSGNRACQAAERLEKMGFEDVRVIDGGIGAFEAAGEPLIRGASKVWSLERQVRFSAGFLVFSGIALSQQFHSSWIYVSLFIAAGLMFSAITNTCGMAMVLARMPWNQKSR